MFAATMYSSFVGGVMYLVQVLSSPFTNPMEPVLLLVASAIASAIVGALGTVAFNRAWRHVAEAIPRTPNSLAQKS
jgi:hypothetical protein